MNINNIGLREWRSKCGCVMQDGKLFNDTIQNNIVLNEENIDYDALKRATEVACINKEIEAMPQGYQTTIGEMGRGLSGGQRQRLLIARALYNVFVNRTVIIIAHRLSTIRKADQIVVLKSGSIIETGNHDQLMQNKQYYYQLIQNQYELDTKE